MTTHPAPQLALIALSPCPFCGGRPGSFNVQDGESEHYWIQCLNCGAMNGERLAKSTPDEEFAIIAWNTRPQSRPEAELPEVTDDVLWRACKAYRPDMDASALGYPTEMVERMRAALQAAYGQQCAATRPSSSVPRKQASDYADGEYGPADLAAIWNACRSEHLRTRTANARGDGVAVVRVDSQGVSFGQYCWISHEKITGYTASAINEAESPTLKAYREWMQMAAPPAPGSEAKS